MLAFASFDVEGSLFYFLGDLPLGTTHIVLLPPCSNQGEGVSCWYLKGLMHLDFSIVTDQSRENWYTVLTPTPNVHAMYVSSLG
jgi:hypothetical protein